MAETWSNVATASTVECLTDPNSPYDPIVPHQFWAFNEAVDFVRSSKHK